MVLVRGTLSGHEARCAPNLQPRRARQRVTHQPPLRGDATGAAVRGAATGLGAVDLGHELPHRIRTIGVAEAVGQLASGIASSPGQHLPEHAEPNLGGTAPSRPTAGCAVLPMRQGVIVRDVASAGWKEAGAAHPLGERAASSRQIKGDRDASIGRYALCRKRVLAVWPDPPSRCDLADQASTGASQGPR